MTGVSESNGLPIGGFAREVLDSLPTLVVVLGPDGRIVEINRTAARLIGRQREELLGTLAWEAVQGPAIGEDARTLFFQRLPHGPFPARYDRLLVSPDGSKRMIRWFGEAIRDENGALRHVVATGQDITETLRATRAEAEQLRLLQTLIDTIPAPIFYKNARGIYLGCNRAFEEMVGKGRLEIVGRTVREVVAPPCAARFEEADQALFRQPGVQTYEARIRFADGSDRDVVFYKATWESVDGMPFGLVGVILDITARKEAERALGEAHAELEARVAARTAELEATKEAAEVADRAKGAFLNIASHELRTPLTSLRLALQRAERELRAGVPVRLGTLERMDRHVRRLVRLSAELLEASRLERGTLELRCAEEEIGALLRTVIEDFQVMAPDRAIFLRLPEQRVAATVDGERLAQAIANLIDNALKYSAPHEPVGVALRTEGDEGVIEVADRGPGIPPEESERLFAPYFRLGSAANLPGLGLGLTIARQIVERHGGTIAYEAPAEGGSRFVVRLPLRRG